MKCPACNAGSRGRDVSIREQTETDAVLQQQRRSRRCLKCWHRWDTLEMPLDEVLRLRRLAHATVMAGVHLVRDGVIQDAPCFIQGRHTSPRRTVNEEAALCLYGGVPRGGDAA